VNVLDYSPVQDRSPRSPVPLLKRSVALVCLGLLAIGFDLAMRGDADVPRKLLLLKFTFGVFSMLLMIWALKRGAWLDYKFWVLVLIAAQLLCFYFPTFMPRAIHN
jgi:hypothetical protein